MREIFRSVSLLALAQSVLRPSHLPMGSTIECAQRASRYISGSGSQH